MTDSELNLRQAVRALMIDPSDRVLLVKLELAFNGWAGWVLPGGGVKQGEDNHAALTRELAEETGVPQVYIGPEILHRRHVGPSVANGTYDGQEEHIYLVPCHEFELAPQMSPEELRAEGVTDTRWWTVDEIEASNEVIKPENLAVLTRQVLDTGAPETPELLEINE